MDDNLNVFITEFSKHLKGTERWSAFCLIASELFDLKRPVFIGETGSLRSMSNWTGDGLSTLLWDFISKITEGCAFSIDQNSKSCELIVKNCTHVIPVHGNSLTRLTEMTSWIKDLDLLYLDSLDYQDEFAFSELHHIGELAICYPNLKKGCLIAIDDCHNDYQGKHILVKEFFKRINLEPILKNYITVWKKPWK